MKRVALLVAALSSLVAGCASPQERRASLIQGLRQSSVGYVGCTADQIDVTVLSGDMTASSPNTVWEAACNGRRFICRDNPYTKQPMTCAPKVAPASPASTPG